ncbi:ATP-binding protein [Saccharibacillus sp. JS10]|uniref:ATP-binding protein n=1 Tax=Saccharibacillus sp. JS10 TaxID=2950552 RepID=UPI00210A7284|nr:ATP-binding protein [Saccharibacillus sp. JS10]MCQ4087421.1 ATP-binding protein [Saccharibacillus sp. JS10]
MIRTVKGSLYRRIAYGTLALFLVLGVLLAAAELVIHRQYADMSEQLENRIDHLNVLQDTERAFLESVSYLRAYAAYGREDLQEQASASRAQYEGLLGELNAGDQQISNMDALIGLNNRFESYYTEALRLIVAGDEQALASLSQTEGSALVRQMEAEFAELVEQQRGLIVEQTDRSRMLARLVLIVPIVALVAALLTALLLIRYLKKSFIEPVIQAESAVRRIEHGESAELDASVHCNEIGSLFEGIGRMAEGIRSRQAELQDNLLQMEEQREELEAQNDELEAQNEQITEQRSQLERALERLTRREEQLEAINTYQRSLVGLTEFSDFLDQAIGQLIFVTGRDAAMLVMRSGDRNKQSDDRWNTDSFGSEHPDLSTEDLFRARFGEDAYELLYSSGYPSSSEAIFTGEPAGPAMQAILANRPVTRRRPVSGAEAGAHSAYETAVDTYYPVYDGGNQETPAGFLLLTIYGDRPVIEGEEELTLGLIRQFIGALVAQLTQAERQQQSEEMERLNLDLETEKRNLLNQRDSTQQVIDSIHEALIVCSPEGEILMCNEITGEMLDPIFCSGRNFADSVDEMNRKYGIEDGGGERIREALASGLNGTRSRYAFEPKGKAARYFEVYVQKVEDVFWGTVHLFVFRDRTEEEEANRLRDEFVSVVSHELRTPLASILGFAEIMLNRSVKPEKAQKYLSTIHGEATRLSGLIGDFLDLQRIEAGKQSYRLLPIDLKVLTSDIAAQWDGRAGHQVRLTMPEQACIVKSDADRLKQVLHNLMSNAVKYSPNQLFVDCEIRLDSSNSAANWIVEVRDYGLGIPEESKSQLFSKFYRVDNSDRRQIGGTGLGLAIVKEMIEGLGGEISFDSTLGVGSTFRFALPAVELSATENTVLVLEDDESLSVLIEEAFRSESNQVRLFSEAETAIFALQEAQRQGQASPKLCIVDLSLGGELSGWDFIRYLTNDAQFRNVPIIVSSALDPPEGHSESETESYLRKPFTIHELSALGQRMMSSTSSKAELVLPLPSEPLARASLQTNGLDVLQIEVDTHFAIAEIATEDEGE